MNHAVKWYRRAADQNHAPAQAVLGLMYEAGLGVPQDNIRAYVWFSVARANGEEKVAQNWVRTANKLTPQDLSQAQREVAALVGKLKIM